VKIKQIIKLIQDFCPECLAEDWDNPGLQIGDTEDEVTGVYLTLDTNISAVQEAKMMGCNLIISHHPLYFRPIKCLDFSGAQGKITKELCLGGITVYAAHTNMDKADGGINTVLAKKAGLINPEILSETGFGMIGEISSEMKLSDYAKHISDALGCSVRVSGDKSANVKKVAVCGGASADFIDDAVSKGADVYITGDVKYHEALSAIDSGIAVIDAGHFGTEIFVIEIFEEILKDTGVKIVKSSNIDCFR